MVWAVVATTPDPRCTGSGPPRRPMDPCAPRRYAWDVSRSASSAGYASAVHTKDQDRQPHGTHPLVHFGRCTSAVQAYPAASRRAHRRTDHGEPLICLLILADVRASDLVIDSPVCPRSRAGIGHPDGAIDAQLANRG